jgi:hypothetical protein
MTDEAQPDLPPAPPVQPAAVLLVEPWQARLEAIAILLLVTVAATLVARLVGAYDQARTARALGESIDLVRVVRDTGEQSGLIAAAGVLVAFLLVTLGPDGRLTGRGILALRATTVIGLIVAGVCGFAGIATLASSDQGAPYRFAGASAGRTALDRLSVGVPLLLAAVIAGYVAWCAFSALGEANPPLFPEGDGDLGVSSEGSWEPPAS